MMDTQNAYLGSNLDKELYIEISEDIEKPEEDLVCLLLRSLYGLKQLANL